MFGLSIGTIVKGFFTGLDLLKKFLTFVQMRQAKQEGRTERDLEVQKETTEVLAKNVQADQKIDQKTDAEVDEEFGKL